MCHEKLVAGSSNERCGELKREMRHRLELRRPLPAVDGTMQESRPRVCVGCGRDATYFPSLCVYVRNAAGGSPAGMRRGR